MRPARLGGYCAGRGRMPDLRKYWQEIRAIERSLPAMSG